MTESTFCVQSASQRKASETKCSMYEHTERGVIWRYSPRDAFWTLLNSDSPEVSRPCQVVRDKLLLCTFPMQWGNSYGFYASLLFQCFRPHCWYPTEGNLYSLESSPAVLYFCSLYPRLDSSLAVSPFTLTLLFTGSIWKTFSQLCLLLWCPSPLHLSLTLSLGCER